MFESIFQDFVRLVTPKRSNIMVEQRLEVTKDTSFAQYPFKGQR